MSTTFREQPDGSICNGFENLTLCSGAQGSNLSQLFLSLQSYEYARSGVKILSLEPMYISTRMVGYSSLLDRPSLGVPSAETYVRHALQGRRLYGLHCCNFLLVLAL